jgi:3-oxo-5-alpha-steroid 4-dehydrogenase 1
MEIVGIPNLIYILFTLAPKVNVAPLPRWNQLLATLYVIHYFNRAIISPFFAAPSMSPIQADTVLLGAVFNWFNSTCLAAWLVGYEMPILGISSTDEGARPSTIPSPLQSFLPYLGLVIFAIGMAGNIRAEKKLFHLRREEADRRAAAAAVAAKREQEQGQMTDPAATSRYSKVYVIPPERGLFRSILYPHYVFEWMEWLGFALVGTAVLPSSYAMPPIKLAPWLIPVAVWADRYHVPLPLPAVIFLINSIANMLPHARWGRKWYVEKFGERAVAGRGAVVPWFKWL